MQSLNYFLASSEKVWCPWLRIMKVYFQIRLLVQIFITGTGMLDSKYYHNSTTLWGLKTTEFLASQLSLGVWKQGELAPSETYAVAFPSSPWWLGDPQHSVSAVWFQPSLHPHMAFALCVSVLAWPSSYKDTSHIDQGSTPLWFIFNNYIYNGPIS